MYFSKIRACCCTPTPSPSAFDCIECTYQHEDETCDDELPDTITICYIGSNCPEEVPIQCTLGEFPDPGSTTPGTLISSTPIYCSECDDPQ